MAIIGVTCLRCGSHMLLIAPPPYSEDHEYEGLYEAKLLLKCKICGNIQRTVMYTRCSLDDVIQAACRQLGADC